MKSLTSGRSGWAETTDISTGGLCCQEPSLFVVGEQVSFVVSMDTDVPIDLQGVGHVVRCGAAPGGGFAIEIDDYSVIPVCPEPETARALRA